MCYKLSDYKSTSRAFSIYIASVWGKCKIDVLFWFIMILEHVAALRRFEMQIIHCLDLLEWTSIDLALLRYTANYDVWVS